MPPLFVKGFALQPDMCQLQVGLYVPYPRLPTIATFDKRLLGMVFGVTGQRFIQSCEGDPAFALDRVMRISQPAIQPERVPRVPGIQADLIRIERGFATGTGFDVALTAGHHYAEARALLEVMIGTQQHTCQGVLRPLGIVIAVNAAIVVQRLNPYSLT